MGRNIGIAVLILVVLGLIWLGYRLLFGTPKDGTACSTTGTGVNDGTIVGGTCVLNSPNVTGNINAAGQAGIAGPTNLSVESILVSRASVSEAGNMNYFFNAVTEADAPSFNLFTSNKTNPQFIHFTVGFQDQCPNLIWYGNWLYSLIKSEQNTSETYQGNQGDRTCFYKLDRSRLPNEIKVRSTSQTFTCPTFRYYLSGVEYRFREKQFGPRILGAAPRYCVYQKS